MKYSLTFTQLLVRILLFRSFIINRKTQADLSFLRKLINEAIDAPELLTGIYFYNQVYNLSKNYPFYTTICSTHYLKNNPHFKLMNLSNMNLLFI